MADTVSREDLDYAEIAREARRVVDAKRAQTVLEQAAARESEPTADPSASPDSSQPRKRLKYTRSKNGCRQCRISKIKCSETTPACLRCVATQQVCVYPDPATSSRKKAKAAGRPSEASPAERERASARPRLSVSPSRSRSNVSSGPSNLPQMQIHARPAEYESRMYGSSMHAGALRMNGFEQPVSDLRSEATPGAMQQSVMITPAQLTARDIHNAVQAEGQTYNFDGLTDFMSFPHPIMPGDPANPDLAMPLSGLPPSLLSSPVLAPTPLDHAAKFNNLNKSTLLSRRTGKVKQVPEQPRAFSAPQTVGNMTVESILHAFTHDETLFEFGPSHRSTNNQLSGTSAQGSIDALSNAFPSPTARSLFLHYCNSTSRICITINAVSAPNPLLSLCTPLKLLDTNSAASAALRMSMLSTSVTHFSYEMQQGVGLEALGPAWAGQKASLRAFGNKFKRAALSNILLAASPESSLKEDDSVLAACLYLIIRDVISADSTWSSGMEYAMNLVSKRGGPQMMLRGPGYTFTRRYLLEQLATHDVFSSFITGKEPTLLGNFDPWWFESVESSQTRWEWESVERTFGISRAMIDLIARMTVLDSRKRRLGISLKADVPEMWDIGQHFIRESHCLLLELDIWGNSLSALPQHVRVSCGDYIYKYMAVVYILAEILEQPTTTPRIVKSIDHVLELCSEAGAMRMPVTLIWPLLISGLHCAFEVRPKVRSLFDAFASDYCEDLEVALLLLEEQWRWMDAGKGKRSWQDVMRALDRSVLIL